MTGGLLWSATGVAVGAYFHKSADHVLLTMSSMGTTALLAVERISMTAQRGTGRLESTQGGSKLIIFVTRLLENAIDSGVGGSTTGTDCT